MRFPAGDMEKDIRTPTIYVLSIGWGDCMAGCAHVNWNYFELTWQTKQEIDPKTDRYIRTPIAKFVGWGGEELENREKYFKIK